MIGWVGDSGEKLFPHFFADADFAGDIETQRSTSGYYSVIRGPNTCFQHLLEAKGSHMFLSPPHEAELVAADYGLRIDGMLAQPL